MTIDRREFLKIGGMAALTSAIPIASLGDAVQANSNSIPDAVNGNADYTLRIARSLVELAPDHVVSTTTYNDQFPGPLLRFKEGQKVVVDIHNDTDIPEQLHWHGQFVPVDVDGAAEEGTPYIPARGMRRIAFIPGPSGFRFYHTHLVAGSDLSIGQYSGLVGPVYIEPRHDPGGYDREVFLTLKEFDPFFSKGGDMAMDFLVPGDREHSLEEFGESAMMASLAKGAPHGYEVGYQTFSINGRMLGHGDPIRVKEGERVLFHILNGSATEIRSLALPGHVFRVIALDGNPVPNPAEVPVLWIGTAERISATVEMKSPGVWILGDLADDDRQRGMGVVIEYAGHKGKPRWITPKAFPWDYRLFSEKGTATLAPPEEVIEMTFRKLNAADKGFNVWTINNVAFDMKKMEPMYHLRRGKRYRLRMRNATDDVHPMHLHRHSFQISNIAGRPVSGVTKDVAMLGGYQTMDIDFTADQPGLSLFHCHMQLHMDFGFMALFDCK
ncbi:multicopper oxidase domain-containing protein [Dyella sp. M7H15-1]|uniref:multicopper oxidase family protein n=1 Tax=Dyella sp. M7H15-1 TaxID=2501295 RepID=UPI00197AF5A8|nr:multicopper oxidase domain-containing protein [Dyella sp. M7H15-1]